MNAKSHYLQLFYSIDYGFFMVALIYMYIYAEVMQMHVRVINCQNLIMYKHFFIASLTSYSQLIILISELHPQPGVQTLND